MGLWSGLVNAVRRLASSGETVQTVGKWTKIWTVDGTRNIVTITKGATDAAKAGYTTLLTWGNAIKVAVVGGFSYLFLTGGASNVVAGTLGISPEVAQVIIIFLFLLLLMLAIRYLFHYIRDRYDLKQEYFDEPIIHFRKQDQVIRIPDERRYR